MDAAPQGDSVPRSRLGVSPHVRRRAGIVAIVERDSAAVCELSLDESVRVGRAALARNDNGGAAWNVDDPASVAALLDALLVRAKLPRRIDVLAPPQSLFGATCTVVPPVKGEALSAVFAHRLREAVSEARGEWLVDSAPIGNPGDEEASSVPSVVAWADRAAISKLDEALRERAIELRRVVPPIVGLLNLLGNARGKGSTGALLVVHVSLPSLCILLFDGEDLLYVRPMRDVLAPAPEKLPEVVQTEVQRTAAYFRENQHGRRVEQILVSGLPLESSDRFCKWLAAGVGSACDPFVVARAEGAPSAEHDDALAAHLPVLAGALLPATRSHLAATRPMNLLPARPRRLPFVAAAAAVVVAGVAAAAWTRESWSAAAANRQRTAARLEAELAALEAGSERRAQALADSQRFAAEERSLAAIDWGAASSLQSALDAMRLVPPGLELTGTKLTRASAARPAALEGGEEPGLELRLRGDFTGEGPALVDELVRAIASRPWCADVSTSVSRSGSGNAATEETEEEVHVEVTLR